MSAEETIYDPQDYPIDRYKISLPNNTSFSDNRTATTVRFAALAYHWEQEKSLTNIQSKQCHTFSKITSLI